MSKVSETKTCGECKWFRQKGGREWGECFAPLPFLFNGHDEEHDPVFPDDPHDNDACPAFDDGSYDKAVDELIAVVGSVDWTNVRAMIDFMKQGPNYWPYADRQLRPFTENIRPAIAAVKKAREERGK